jgi:excisionase family DNA binding protein
MPSPPSFFTVAEAAERLGCSRRLLYSEIKKGNLAARRLGGSALWRISEEALAQFQRPDAAATIAAYLEKNLAAAPPLSAEQKTRLTELLRPARAYLRTQAAHP